MTTDVPATASQRIVAEAAGEGARPRVQRACQAALFLEHPPVAKHQPHQGHEIGRRPVAVHEGLAEANVAAGQRPKEEPIVVHRQRRIQLAGITESIRAVRAPHGQHAARQAAEAREKRCLRPVRQHRPCSVHDSAGTARPAAHAARSPTPFAVTRDTTGAPFHHSFTACQWICAITHAVTAGCHQHAPHFRCAPRAAFERQRRVEADCACAAGLHVSDEAGGWRSERERVVRNRPA